MQQNLLISRMDSFSLISVSDLPAPFRSTFSFRYFNSLQSECFPVCFLSDVNMVISAPTGSGKTVLFELCILRLLSRSIYDDGRFIHIKGTLKTIYIAPSKALVQEKLRDWNHKLGSLGVNCLELTGDNESYNIKTVHESDIILTTPEKFDAVTRYRINDGGLSFFSDIALVLIDEVHLLNDARGASLEAIVSRIKILNQKSEMKSTPLAHVRFLAVSATIPNIEDLAEWLSVPAQGVKRFGEEMRPVKLMTKVFGYTPAKNDFLFEKRLQNYIFDVLMQYSRGKSALVFCATRKGAQETAQRVTQVAMTYGYSNPFIKNNEQRERLREASLSCGDKQMQSYILYGVGYHNGGLSLKDRNLVESLFLSGDLQILCTTNTLAHGINLPAHTVIIKSTQYFNKEKGLYMEYDRSMILQMSGRAGRPPFDDTGMVIVMTRRETVHLYQNLLSGCENVESQLLSCMTEHLTAEIVQLTISDITRAIEWMKCSYLYVRMKKNPENYAVKKEIPRNRIEHHLREICVQKVNELSRYQMIWTDEDGFLLKPLEPGKLMTKYYLKFDTMKHIMQTPYNCSLEDALHVVCSAEELSWIKLRRNEKKLLNDINNEKESRLRFHVFGDKGKKKKRIQTSEEKLFVLTNDCLTGDPSIHDLSLTQDMNSVCSNGCRVAKCMKEYFIYQKNYKGVLNSSLLAKSLYQRLWDDSPYLLKQLPGIGMVTAKALHSMGIISFQALDEADPRRIEMVTGRKFPFGNHIKESVLSLPPKVEMKLEEIECEIPGRSIVVITLTRLSQPSQFTKRHSADMIIGCEEENFIHFHEKIRVDEFSSPYSATIGLLIPKQGILTVRSDLIFEDYVGIDLHQRLPLLKEFFLNVNNVHRNIPPTKEVLEADNEKSIHTHAGELHPKITPGKKKFEANNEKKSHDCSEELRHKITYDKEIESMPSFTLINEASFEDDGEVLEKEAPAMDTAEDDDCKIITEKTVFEHIRRKSKNFPSLATINNAYYSLSSRQSLPLSKRCEPENMVDLSTDMVAPIWTEIKTNPSSVTASLVPTLCPTKHMDQTGFMVGESSHRRTSTEENIFDLTSRKSMKLPLFDETYSLDVDLEGHPPKNHTLKGKPMKKEIHTNAINIPYSPDQEMKNESRVANFNLSAMNSNTGAKMAAPTWTETKTNPSPQTRVTPSLGPTLGSTEHMDLTGFMVEDNSHRRTLTEENIFDLISRKSKKLPLFDKTNLLDVDMEGHPPENHSLKGKTIEEEIPTYVINIQDSPPQETQNESKDADFNLSPMDSNTRSKMERTSLDIWFGNKNTQNPEAAKKQRCSFVEEAAVGQKKEPVADSFLGFQSTQYDRDYGDSTSEPTGREKDLF